MGAGVGGEYTLGTYIGFSSSGLTDSLDAEPSAWELSEMLIGRDAVSGDGFAACEASAFLGRETCGPMK